MGGCGCGAGVVKSAGLMMTGIFISRVGFIRERAVAISAGRPRPAFFAAFAIPDLMYYILVGGALSAAFIPVFTGYRPGVKRRKAGMYSTFINITILLLLLCTGLGIISLLPWLL